MQPLEIVNAHEHNLQNLTLTIPPRSLTVFTGVSGSGKSSLAFDTIYAESQRRYIESFTAYARQFLAKLERPAVDAIRGLSPAIAVEQKTVSRSPRSTVGTATEIYDYLRLLYAAIGIPHCPTCGTPIRRQAPEAIAAWAMGQPIGTKLMVLAPLARQRKGAFKRELAVALKRGFPRARIDGVICELDEGEIQLDKRKAHDVEVIVDRLVVKPGSEERLRAAVQAATELANGLVVLSLSNGEEVLFSLRLACPDCGMSLPDPEPRSFSFNSRFGACEQCNGLGAVTEIVPEAIVSDPGQPLGDLAFRVSDRQAVSVLRAALQAVARRHQVSLETAFRDAPPEMRRAFLYGTTEKLVFQHGENAYRTRWVGVANYLKGRLEVGRAARLRADVEQLTQTTVCSACGGARLRPEARAVTVQGRPIAALTQLPLTELEAWVRSLRLTAREAQVAAGVLHEIQTRLRFLIEIGLGYLTLDRPTSSLSGGESQRVQLATQLGAPLRGVLYVLDEPSVGLHPRDNQRLLASLERLRDAGNTVIVVEHDEATIRRADWVVDLGPGAGRHGGRLVAAGPPEAIMAAPESVTGRYLIGAATVARHRTRRTPSRGYVTVIGASHNNLRDLTVRFPIGLLTVVTGVSGAGKSSLVIDTLYRALSRTGQREGPPGAHRRIEGAEAFDKVIEIDQSPIGRTPRSNPATYTGVFTPIRELYASLPEAKARGYRAGRFSFNVKGGRCEACEGDGLKRIEMAFLPDVYVPCEVCRGRRYNRETLQVKYHGRNIAETLDLTIEEALTVFAAWPAITRKLQTLVEVGLGYVTLGQAATTLSGGEAQRLKLACELARRATGRTLYILDEPTTGLHFEDVRRLLEVLHALIDQGNTVIVIEHHTDVMWAADWIIDLGPEGGTEGGQLVGEGPPETIARLATATGAALAAAAKAPGLGGR
ncbi:MAG: excinuclease ABC subunit UvrA [Chloracidobacterium sp.]|nr:excinuclease ABC subunit UvrA [Chloracidobacterium sp.]MDW8216964.1 excinuclease ABC subunit UvrA [Acidobacteriota bacterium]